LEFENSNFNTYGRNTIKQDIWHKNL
jgi:hypothetical protein